MQEKLAALWAQAQEKVRPLSAKVKERGVASLRQVIQEQGSGLWTKAQEMAKAAWQWLAAKVKAVPGFKPALMQVAVALAAVALWLVFKTVPGAMAATLSLTMVAAYLALIMAFLAYGGVNVILSAVQSAETVDE